MRSWAAGSKSTQIILGFLAANILLILIQSVISLVFMYIIFGVPLYGDLGWILFILCLQGCCGMSFGMYGFVTQESLVLFCKICIAGLFLAASLSDHTSFVHASVCTILPAFTLSSTLWPLDGLPFILKYVCQYQPMTFAVQAIRDIMTKGWAVSVYYACITTGAWICVFALGAFLAVKIRPPN